MLSGCELGWNTKLRRTEHPVWIGEVVQEAKVFKAAISRIEAIPLRFFDGHAQITLRIGAPAGRVNQECFEERAFAVTRPEQERAVEESWPSLVVEIALI